MTHSPISALVQSEGVVQPSQREDLLPGAGNALVLDRHPRNYLLLPPGKPLSLIKRLVLFVPEGKVDLAELARLVIELSGLNGSNVLLVGVFDGPGASRESQRWVLVKLEALIREGGIRASSRLIEHHEVLSEAKHLLHNDDLCLCLQDHHVMQFGVARAAFAPLLSKVTVRPVYVIADVNGFVKQPAPKLVKEVLGWSLAIGVIIANSLVLSKLFQENSDLGQTVLAIGSVVFTLAILQIINQWIG